MRNSEGESEETKCKPRPYRLGQREAAMEETRVRVIEAARELILGENALSGFSMEAVARQAGITRVTIYHRFGSKRGLLEALFDDMGARGRLAERLPQVFAEPDAREALRLYVEVFCDFWEGDRAVHHRLGGFVALDSEFAAAIAERAGRRRSAIDALLRRLGTARPSSSKFQHQMQILQALTGFHFYDTLAGKRKPKDIAPLIYRMALSALEIEA